MSSAPQTSICWPHPLENGNGEGSGFAGSGLSLSDAVTARNDGHDGSLLNSRRSLETVGIDSSQELAFQVHVVKAVPIASASVNDRKRA